MICPYIRGTGIEVMTHTYTYDADSRLVSDQTVSQDSQTMLQCVREECAAWCDGKCSRK
jgi:hypothetical protein